MTWLTREALSERHFPGWRAWLTRVFVVVWLAGFVSELGRSRLIPKLFDTFSVLLLWPLVTILVLWLLAWGCMRLWRVSFEAALAGLSPLLPSLMLVPVLEQILHELGASTNMTFANGWQALAALLSGGWLPFSVPPSAALLLWCSWLIWLAWSWWRVTPERSRTRLVEALAPSYLGFPLVFLVPSFVGWSLMLGEVPIWSASSTIVARAFAAAQIDGYAWANVYERFPFAIGGEAYLSQAWLLAILAFLVVVTVVFIHLSRSWRWSWRRWWLFVDPARFWQLGGAVLLGVVVAALFDAVSLRSLSHLLALFILLISSALFILAQAARDDLSQAAQGSLAHGRPLALGLVRTADLNEWRGVWLLGGGVGAVLLGWPVFLSFVWAELIRIHAPLVLETRYARLATALASAGYFLAGWMTMTERGSFGALAPALAGLVFLGTCVELSAFRTPESRKLPS